jgi:hypothetical protein
VLQKNVTKQKKKKKNHLGFFLFAVIRNSGTKKRNVKANGKKKLRRWRSKKIVEGEGRDEHYSNLFTVGPMIRHNDINKQS